VQFEGGKWPGERRLRLYRTRGPRGGSEVEYLYLFIRALSVRHLGYFVYSYRGVGEERWRKLRIRADKV